MNNIKKVFIIFAAGLTSAIPTFAQDKILYPDISYAGTPRSCIIGGINISGVQGYEDYMLSGISGLQVGQEITVPGADITNAVKRYWRHGLFSDVQISADSIVGRKIYLHIALKTRPRVSVINYEGLKKSEREDMENKLGLLKGSQITPNMIDRAKILAKKYFDDKGFKNAEITIRQRDDVANKGNVILDVIVDKKEKMKVRNIFIEGNKALSLSKIKGGLFKKGAFSKTHEAGRLGSFLKAKKFTPERWETDKKNLIEKYNEYGYRDATILKDSVWNVDPKHVDIYLKVDEGQKYYLRNITWVGNTVYPTQRLNAILGLKKGDVYNQKLLEKRVSKDEIQSMGHFDPEKSSQPDVKPNPEDGTVDINYNLEQKSNDQIEFSLGWGQTGVIGKVGLKLNNFSMANLFRKNKEHRGIMPIGDGEVLSLSAQTNGTYYQSYNASYSTNWLGGKRPNQFSVGVYFSKMTDVSSSYYNDTYRMNYLNSYYSGYGYGYGNYNNNYYENYYDPDTYMRMYGVSIGWGKRLRWPDDYFVLSAQLAYQRYELKNWKYFLMTNGAANNLNLSISLSRTSTDNPLFPRRGSEFTASVTLTPPWSVWSHKDYKNLAMNPYSPTYSAEQQEKYRWVEYHKWKFKAKTYTALSGGQKCFVLMTRIEMGLLGSYNKYKKSPFETYYVGGDGMSGYSSSYADETIGLRGYDNGSLAYNGYAYDRFTLELRYPFLLGNTTIYGLGFVEAGNAWSDTKYFNPFDMKRSAGLGVRIYLPMVGLMGIDWAYGFDKDNVNGKKGGSQFHFILGQEF